MNLFLDASALVAMLGREPEAALFADRVATATQPITSAIAIWEAARGLANVRGLDVAEARAIVVDYIDRFDILIATIGAAEADLALDAHQRFGKGRHKAALNMGDCFAYACTVRNDAELLFKGDDFIHTDLKDATLP